MSERKDILQRARSPLPDEEAPNRRDALDTLSTAAGYKQWVDTERQSPGLVQAAADAWDAKTTWRPDGVDQVVFPPPVHMEQAADYADRLIQFLDPDTTSTEASRAAAEAQVELYLFTELPEPQSVNLYAFFWPGACVSSTDAQQAGQSVGQGSWVATDYGFKGYGAEDDEAYCSLADPGGPGDPGPGGELLDPPPVHGELGSDYETRTGGDLGADPDPSTYRLFRNDNVIGFADLPDGDVCQVPAGFTVTPGEETVFPCGASDAWDPVAYGTPQWSQIYGELILDAADFSLLDALGQGADTTWDTTGDATVSGLIASVLGLIGGKYYFELVVAVTDASDVAVSSAKVALGFVHAGIGTENGLGDVLETSSYGFGVRIDTGEVFEEGGAAGSLEQSPLPPPNSTRYCFAIDASQGFAWFGIVDAGVPLWANLNGDGEADPAAGTNNPINIPGNYTQGGGGSLVTSYPWRIAASDSDGAVKVRVTLVAPANNDGTPPPGFSVLPSIP